MINNLIVKFEKKIILNRYDIFRRGPTLFLDTPRSTEGQEDRKTGGQEDSKKNKLIKVTQLLLIRIF